MGEELCPALGLTIPVGKDSMSMKPAGRKAASSADDLSAVAGHLPSPVSKMSVIPSRRSFRRKITPCC